MLKFREERFHSNQHNCIADEVFCGKTYTKDQKAQLQHFIAFKHYIFFCVHTLKYFKYMLGI